MRRSRSSLGLFARWLWLLFTWSVLLAPSLVGAEPAAVRLPAPPRLLPAHASASGQPVVGDEPTPFGESISLPAEVLPQQTVAWQPCYWFVSSRESAQHPRDWRGCPLDVTYRAPDGRLYHGDIPSMVSQFTPGTPVLICVHGSFVSTEDNLKESGEAYAAIRQCAPQLPLHVVFFTWPSDGPLTCIAPIDIGIRGTRADFNGFHIAWLLSQIPDHHPVCLFGHSHGCRGVMSTLQLIAGGSIQDYSFIGDRSPHQRVRAVLAAPAFDHNWLNPGQRYGLALGRAEAVLSFRNSKDLPLAFYPLTRPFAHRALARTGLTWRDRSKLASQNAKVAECDVTQLLGRQHYWPEYYSRPQIVGVAVPYIYFVSAGR
jgi:hypothetical protein